MAATASGEKLDGRLRRDIGGTLQTRIDRLALESENAENTFMNAAQGLSRDEAALLGVAVSDIVSGNGVFRGWRDLTETKTSLAAHRSRKARQGFVRVEVSVRREDAGLVRGVASALSDPARQHEARSFLRQRFAEPPTVSLKALLASAPLDGIVLDRSPDSGRDVDL